MYNELSIVTTPDKKGVIAIYHHDIYELKVENGDFIWKESPMKTKIKRSQSVALLM